MAEGSMPDQTGKLTREEKTRISEVINTRWAGRSDTCPICGATQWFIADHLVSPVTLGAHHGLQLSGPLYPLVQLVSPCGYIRFLNAVILGVVSPPTVPDEAAKAAEPSQEEKK